MILIDKDALIEAMGEEPLVWNDEADEIAERFQWQIDMSVIKEQPIVESCEDAISREAVRKIIWNDLEINPNEDGMIFEAQSHIDRDIQLLPTVAPSRPSGEWIKFTNEYGLEETKCSECGISFTTYDTYGWHYCHNCGAKMKGADDEHDK